MENNKPKVRLTGKDGNAFAVIAECHKAWKKTGQSEDKWKEIQTKMMSGNYDQLLQTAMEHFDVS